ncbi:MAG: hypothetical protein WD382_04645 [Halofilum sp. (in: g-proteobacteria)]
MKLRGLPYGRACLLSAVLMIAACDEGPAEEAGEQVDEGAEEAQEQGEEAAEQIQEGAEEATGD